LGQARQRLAGRTEPRTALYTKIWTHPVALKSFLYIPSGKILELITFEVKPENDYRIEGVFETAAHSRFSHKSYLVIYGNAR
jgi:hypothetical protein